ncbi:MAG TPA: hypothetical protein VJK52_00060 [Candidatus Nanoarchaeia archaeon]|nr:hypothetical protein [Candidatus Nanoarchaeia archaeon]
MELMQQLDATLPDKMAVLIQQGNLARVVDILAATNARLHFGLGRDLPESASPLADVPDDPLYITANVARYRGFFFSVGEIENFKETGTLPARDTIYTLSNVPVFIEGSGTLGIMTMIDHRLAQEGKGATLGPPSLYGLLREQYELQFREFIRDLRSDHA